MAQRCADIDEFSEKVKELYKHREGSLTMRATNDELWLTYRTDQASDMRRLEALQLWLTAAMAGSDVETLTAEAEAAEKIAEEERRKSKKGKGKKKGGG